MSQCNWIFLSKHGQDEYINMFAASVGAEPMNTDHFDYHYDVIVDDRVLVLRGILKHKIMHNCWADKKTFYYMDSGYLGNTKSRRNPLGAKQYHRIVKNNLQHGSVVERSDDRLKKLGVVFQPRKYGTKIIVAAPDEKPCRFYGIDKDQWVQETVNTLKTFTDRPIEIRERAPKRQDRVDKNPLSAVLANNVHALVTFNSVAATEAIVNGIPAFPLAPCNAAIPVGNSDLSKIENPYFPTNEERHAWACHLAYGQFSVSELRDGTAYRLINETT